MMLTRCPNCATAFRVSLDQITARHGKVRCGHCTTIFNALDTLVDVTASDDSPQEGDRPRTGQETRHRSGASPLPERRPGSRSEYLDVSVESALDAGFGDGPQGMQSDRLLEELRELEPMEDVVTDEDYVSDNLASDDMAAQTPKRRRVATWLWAFAAVLMLLTLSGHAAYVFRGELAARYPELRPHLAALCVSLGCDVPLPRTPDLVSIESSDLHPDNKQKNRMTLVATIKNRARYVQAYPYIELTLTDTKDRALASRVLEPKEYLRPGTDVAEGFAAQGEMPVGATIEVRELEPTGYRVYVFYP